MNKRQSQPKTLLYGCDDTSGYCGVDIQFKRVGIDGICAGCISVVLEWGLNVTKLNVSSLAEEE